MTVHDDLGKAWECWESASLYRKWRQANPGEAAKLDAYRAGGSRPALVSSTGKALVHETDAWFASSPQDPTPIVEPDVRTNYDADPLGGELDPLWYPHGKHAGPGATIEIVDDPERGHVQKHVVKSGSVLWGGDRCEVMSNRIGGPFGTRLQVRFDLLLPVGFQSGDGWDSLWDLHYPNDGPAQSPITFYARNNSELWARVLGGPLTQDGTMGSIRHEEKVATLKQGVWNRLGFDIFLHDVSGLCDAWVNGEKVTSWGAIPTISVGAPNTTYWKQGFYRNPNHPAGTQTYLFDDTLCWYEDSPDAMLAWASSVSGNEEGER